MQITKLHQQVAADEDGDDDNDDDEGSSLNEGIWFGTVDHRCSPPSSIFARGS